MLDLVGVDKPVSEDNIRVFTLNNSQAIMGDFKGYSTKTTIFTTDCPEVFTDEVVTVVNILNPMFVALQAMSNGGMGITMIPAAPFSDDDKIELSTSAVAYDYKPKENVRMNYRKKVQEYKAAAAGIVKAPQGLSL